MIYFIKEVSTKITKLWEMKIYILLLLLFNINYKKKNKNFFKMNETWVVTLKYDVSVCDDKKVGQEEIKARIKRGEKR